PLTPDLPGQEGRQAWGLSGWGLNFFEEGQASPFVLGHFVSLGEGFHGTCTRHRGEVVEGDDGAAFKSLLAAVEEISFTVSFARAAE
ncbi:MAG: hypothetical protein WCJ23_05390, partial [Verrucomicrobiota bacterium]